MLLAQINTLIKVTDFAPEMTAMTTFEGFILGSMFQVSNEHSFLKHHYKNVKNDFPTHQVLIVLAEYTLILKTVVDRKNKVGVQFSSTDGHQIARKWDQIFKIISPILNVIFIMLYFPISNYVGIQNKHNDEFL